MLKLVTITPHRNRLPQLRHHLRSIAEQTRPPDQVVVSCQGDTIETRREIVELLEATGVPKQMWAVGASDDPWCKPLAINWAIRRTEEDVDVVATLDVDCILHPEMIAQLEIALEQDSDRYVMCQNLSLPKHFGIPYHWTYEGLREHARFLEWKGAAGGTSGLVVRGAGGR